MTETPETQIAVLRSQVEAMREASKAREALEDARHGEVMAELKSLEKTIAAITATNEYRKGVGDGVSGTVKTAFAAMGAIGGAGLTWFIKGN